MIRCFLTGVQFHFEEAFVLNRRGSRDLFDSLKDRVASLRRVIEQLSPLDEEDDSSAATHSGGPGSARKKHRLVCKAVADALAPGFPEIKLFLTWAEYRAHVRRAAVNADPSKQSTLPILPDDEHKHLP